MTAFLFVDSRVPDLQNIVDAAQEGVTVVVLDPAQDGVRQIAQAVEGKSGVASIGIVSHGAPGVLLLGSGPLFAGNLQAHAADLQAIGATLADTGDILLYGCDVGAGEQGAAFVGALADLTGADVAASDDATAGGTRGDWDLEITTGSIEAAPALETGELAGYDQSLHTATAANLSQLQAALTTARIDGQDDTITLLNNILLAGTTLTINVTDGRTTSIVGGGFTLSGNNAVRVLDVQGGKVALGNITIANGFLAGAGGNANPEVPWNGMAGGNGGDALGAGIRNAGTLTISNSTITANKAAGGGGGAGYLGGAGGGGGGFGSTPGGNGGSAYWGAGAMGSAGAGGMGSGFGTLGGGGGNSTGGAGGTYYGYSPGGAGGTAASGPISIGGGAGGASVGGTGGRGGNAAAAIYNTGTLTITGSTFSNNIAAGGGGAGGASDGSTLSGAGGAGGNAVANIWNAGGVLTLDTATNSSLAGASNVAGAGSGGPALKAPNASGANGSAVTTVSTTAGGTTTVATLPTSTIATKRFSSDSGISNTDFLTNVAAQTISGTTSANLVAGEFVEVSLDNGATWSTATSSVGTTTWSIAKTLSGSGTLQVRVSNAIGTGTASTQAYVLDTVAPTFSMASNKSSLKIGETATITVTFSEDPGTGFGLPDLIVSGGSVSGLAGSGTTRTMTFTPTAGVNGGMGTIGTVAGPYTDAAGNVAGGSGIGIAYDTLAPAAPSAPDLTPATDTGAFNNDNLTNSSSPAFSGTAEAGATVTLYVNGSTVLGSATADGSGAWSYTASLAEGVHSVTAKAADAAGNVGAASAALAVTIDRTAPANTVTSIALSQDSGSSNTDFVTNATSTQRISGTLGAALLAGERVELSMDNGATWSDGGGGTGFSSWTVFTALTSSGVMHVRVLDAAGNATAARTQAYTLDTTPPTTTVATMALSADTGVSGTDFVTRTATQTISGSTSANLLAGETVEVSVNNGASWTTATSTTGASTWSIVATLSGSSTLQARVVDAAGNSGATMVTNYVLDTSAPALSSVSSSSANGTYKAGDVVAIQVNFNDNVFVSGTPQLTLETGTTDRVLNYTGGSGSSTLTFSYTVQAGDTSSDLDYAGTGALALNGGSIRDVAGNDATLALAAPGSAGSLGAAKNIVIDTLPPTVTGVTSSSPSGTYGIGNVISIQVNFNDLVTVTGTPTLTLETGTTDRVVNYTGGSGSNILTFDYTVQAGDVATDLDYIGTAALAFNGGTIRDQAGNDAILTLAAPGASTSLGANNNFRVDTTPKVTSVTSPATDRAYKAGDVIAIDLTFTSAVFVAGSPTLALETGASDASVGIVSGSGTNTLRFAYTVRPGDTSADLAYLGANALALNGGTIRDATGQDASLTLPTPGLPNSLDRNKAIVIDTAAPTTTITSIAFSSDSGTPGDFITNIDQQTVTVTTSAGLAPGEIVAISIGLGWVQATSVGPNTWSAGVFTLPGSSTLQAAVIDAAGNVGPIFSQAYVLDTQGPTFAMASDKAFLKAGETATITFTFSEDPGAGFGLPDLILSGGTLSELSGSGTTRTATFTPTAGVNAGTGTIGTVPGPYTDAAGNPAGGSGIGLAYDTLAPSLVVGTDRPTLKAGETATITFTFSEDPGASFTFEDVEVTGGTLSPLSGTGLVRTAVFTPAAATNNGAGGVSVPFFKYTDAAGNSGSAAGAAVYFDTLPPSAPSAPDLALASDSGTSSSDDVTTDNTPTFTGTAEAGSNVTLYDTDGTTVLGTTVATGGAWSITSSTLGNGTHTITAKATDAAGNASAASAALNVTVDTVAPTTVNTGFAFSDDSGTSATDFITNSAAQVISGTLSANLAAGEGVQVSLDGGATWSAASSAAGSNTWSVAATLSSGSQLVARVVDAAGNTGVESSRAYTLDTSAPAATIATLSLSADTGVSNSDFVTRTALQTLSGTTSAPLGAGEFVEVSFDNGATWTAGTAGSSAWSLAGFTLPASGILQVRVSDVAGNAGTAVTQAYAVDTAGPTNTVASASFSADRGASSSDFLTNNATQTISGTTSANLAADEHVEVSVDNGLTWATATGAAGTNAWSIAATLGSANAVLLARVVDAAGNAGSNLVQAYTLDTAAPPASTPDLDAGSDSGLSNTDNLTNEMSPVFTGTAEAGATVTLYGTDGSTVLGTGVASSAGTWAITSSPLANGSTHTITTRVTDRAGNVSAPSAGLAVTVDNAPPTNRVASAQLSADTGRSDGDFVTSVGAQTISGTLDANLAADEVVRVSVDGTTWSTATSSAGQNTWSYSTTLAGSGTLRVGVFDAAGNPGFVTGQAYEIDTTAPTTTVTGMAFSADTGTPGDFLTSSAAQRISGTTSANLAAGEGVEVSIDNGASWAAAASAVGSNTWTILRTLAGSNTVQVRVTDLAGNAGAAASQAYVLDAATPAAPAALDLVLASDSGSSASDDITSDTTPTITGTAEAGATVTLYDSDGTTVLGTTTAVGGTWSITSGTLADGTHTLTATATDAAGNVSPASAALSLTIDAAGPTVRSVSSTAADGTYKAGDVIALQVGFSEAVTVSGTPQLTLETGTTDRVVDYVSGSGTSSLTFRYTVQAGDTSADLDYLGTTAFALNGGTIRDAAGNDASTVLAVPGTAGSLGVGHALAVDGVAPQLVAATANTNTVDLRYSKPLNAATLPAASAFTVRAGSATIAVTTVAYDAAANAVLLTLGTAVSEGQAVSIGYTDPSAGDDANALQDLAGNDAASLGEVAVANATPNRPATTGDIPAPAGFAPQPGVALAFDPALLADPEGVQAGSLSYQWQRDGAAIAGAQSASYAPGLQDVGSQLSLVVRYVDGRGNAESVVVPVAQRIADSDGVTTLIESLAPALGGGVQGDGNGDGVLDAYQVGVTSAPLATAAGAAGYVTMVADAAAGGVDTSDANLAVITGFGTGAVTGDAPANVRYGTSLEFTAAMGGSAQTETFSVFVDGSLDAQGFWVQDNGGDWHNVTATIVEEGGKTRLDFAVEEGGAFDRDGLANGSVSLVGVVADAPEGIGGIVPVFVAPGSFWF